MMRALAVALLFALSADARELTPQELRGRQIYRTGESPSGQPIVAAMGVEDLELPATALPCMSCHGRDGRGKDEAGVQPSNLQWDALTKPYAATNASGRQRVPYTPALLKRAITMGVDSGKTRLHVAMPRYSMSIADADDLVAYLQRIGNDPDPGLTDTTISIGMLLPTSATADAIRDALQSHFASVNEAGGIFGRKLVLTENEEPFAIVAAHISGRERETGAMLAEKRIPAIAAFSSRADHTNRYLFHLLPAIEEQSLALIGTQKVRIVHDDAHADIAERLAAHADPQSTTVLWLSTDADALSKLDAKTILIPAALAPAALPPHAQVFIAAPTTRPPREIALAAAKLLTRALERAGRELDRELLVETLESFRREPNGITPPVTWTTAKRVGVAECTVVRVQ